MAKNMFFFAFCLIENHRDIYEMGCGNKKCLFIIYKHFLFSQLKNFFLQIFHDCQGSWKPSKFKSKKQIFLDFCFLLHEALLDPLKDLGKRKNYLSKNWVSYGPKIDFFRYFWSKIHVDLTLEPNISGSGVELGACDTPLESYFRCLQEYVDNSWKRPIKFGR